MPRIHKGKPLPVASLTLSTVSLPQLPTELLQGAQESVKVPLASVSQGVDALTQLLVSGPGALTGLFARRASPAARLKAALATSEEQGFLGNATAWGGAILSLGGLIGSASALLSPTGPGGCDHNPLERCANCCTSVPYVLVGAHAIQHRRTTAGKVWGASMCGVGLASVGFHASSGKWRTLGRRLDYWSIAASSSLLTRAVYPNIPPAVTAAGLALTPFKPFLVSFLNSAAMELKFLHRAHKNKALRKTQQLHAVTSLLGLSAFALEEFMPELPLIHSAWHCLSATAVATVNNLLDDVELQQLGPRSTPQAVPRSSKQLALTAA